MSRRYNRSVTAEFRLWHRAVIKLAEYYGVDWRVLVRAAENDNAAEFRPPLAGAAYPAYKEGYITKDQARVLGVRI